MSWTMLRERGDKESTREFKKAAMMAKEGLERMCELAEEMEDKYSERTSYSGRGDYGERDEYYERRRDSRGRYM